MQEVRGKVAVVTGGGSGIGRGMALAFAGAGMHVVLADIEGAAAEAVRKEVETRGVRGLAIPTDVSDRASVEKLAEETFRAFGGAHLLCNNAGVSVFGPLDQTSDADWRWVLSVNLEGVIHGIQAFVPRMRDARSGGHVVNTASIAGHAGFPGLGVYCTTKFAVVGLSEALRQDLAPHGIGVSVLCPSFVKTRIAESTRNRPGRLGGPGELPGQAGALLQQIGMEAEEVGRLVLEAVQADELYIFTHPETRAVIEQRYQNLLSAYDAIAARSACRNEA